MSQLINLSICVSDIPKEQIKIAKNGKKYMNITVAERREIDQYDNTHTVFMSQTKEDREAKIDRTYIGSGKAINFAPVAVTPESVERMPPVSEIDDLPF